MMHKSLAVQAEVAAWEMVLTKDPPFLLGEICF